MPAQKGKFATRTDELVKLLRHLDKHGFVADPEIEIDAREFQNLVTEVLQAQ